MIGPVVETACEWPILPIKNCPQSVRTGGSFYIRFFRRQKVTAKHSARYRVMDAPVDDPT